MEKLEELLDTLRPVMDKVRDYRFNPVESPHGLSESNLAQLERTHMFLETILWKFRLGELEEKLQKAQIDLETFIEEVEKLASTKEVYKYI